MHLNSFSRTLCDHGVENAARLRIAASEVDGARIIDFGIASAGGLAAGRLLARICLGDLATVSLVPESADRFASPVAVTVATDQPTIACLGGQYAGWPVQTGKYFAMGSGPMRMARGREELLEQLGLIETQPETVVGVLETDVSPTAEVIHYVADECGVPTDAIHLCVAPVTSIAGVVQVVARSVETAMHKLVGLGFDAAAVHSGFGVAPLPPIATSMAEGIGRTNDAILYGGRVTLWVDADQGAIDEIGPQVPSSASGDHGRPFAEIFKSYDYDFYKVDPHLFSPALVTMVNLRSGLTRTFGEVAVEVLRRSFGATAARDAKVASS